MTADLEPAFLSAIQSDPDNPTHRLVYADWLEESGDPRAELVRLSVRIQQFPRKIVIPDAAFEWRNYRRVYHQCREQAGLISRWSNWCDCATVPFLITMDEFPGWWMWQENKEPSDWREFRRQVEALTKPPITVNGPMRPDQMRVHIPGGRVTGVTPENGTVTYTLDNLDDPSDIISWSMGSQITITPGSPLYHNGTIIGYATFDSGTELQARYSPPVDSSVK